MATRSTLLCLALATSLSAQKSQMDNQDPLAPAPKPVALTAADRIDLLKAERRFEEGDSVFGLPKVAPPTRMKGGKKKKKKEEEEKEEAAE